MDNMACWSSFSFLCGLRVLAKTSFYLPSFPSSLWPHLLLHSWYFCISILGGGGGSFFFCGTRKASSLFSLFHFSLKMTSACMEQNRRTMPLLCFRERSSQPFLTTPKWTTNCCCTSGNWRRKTGAWKRTTDMAVTALKCCLEDLCTFAQVTERK